MDENICKKYLNVWLPVSLGGESYMIKKGANDDGYRICLSDCIYMWTEDLGRNKIYDRCKYLNPLMEGDEENLVQWVLSLLQDEENMKIHKADNMRVLEMNSKMCGISFTFKFYLNLASPEVLHQELTLPLLLMVHQLQEQKISLFEIIKKKDTEISEYKMLGAELIRKSNETPQFVGQVFEEGFPSETNFSDKVITQPITVFTENIQNLYFKTVNKYKCARSKLQDTAMNVTENGIQSSSIESSPEKRVHTKLEDDYLEDFMKIPPKKNYWSGHEEVNAIKEEDQKNRETALKAKLLAKKKQQKKKLPL